MSLLNLLPFRYRMKLLSAQHDRICKPILETPPIRNHDDGLILFSMMGTKVLLPYLVAVKSLWSQLQRGRVIILDDGTLTGEDRNILNHHCDSPQIISIGDVDISGFLSGGTWERLLSILDRRDDDYVIQLDSDTVTIGPVTELKDAIRSNQSFALGGDVASAKRGVEAVTHYTNTYLADRPLPPSGNEHIQLVMERKMIELQSSENLQYIRACSGFAGFSKATGGRTKAQAFVNQYREMIGEQTLEQWGSEQFMSNLLIANEPVEPVVLPADKYVNFWGEPWSAGTSFVHFLGTHRYTGTAYADATRLAIRMIDKELKDA